MKAQSSKVKAQRKKVLQFLSALTFQLRAEAGVLFSVALSVPVISQNDRGLDVIQHGVPPASPHLRALRTCPPTTPTSPY